MRSDLTTKRRRDSKGNSVPAAPRTGRSTRSSVGGAKSSSGMTPSLDLKTNSSPRLADAYQEADGNFEFSRKSKRVKSSNERPVREEPKAPIKTSVVVEITEDPNRSKRSKPRQSEAVPQTESKSLQAESRPKAPKASTQHGREREKSRMDDAGLPQATAPSPPKERRRVSGTTIVEVPLSETPVIQRNQRMRDKAGGGRRSSFGRRGRRASSLLDSGIIGMSDIPASTVSQKNLGASPYYATPMAGLLTQSLNFTADPHSEVSHRDWYKHIGEDVEPRRMRQLLVWCGRKALKDTPEAKKSKTDRIAQQAGVYTIHSEIASFALPVCSTSESTRPLFANSKILAQVIDEELVRVLVDSPEVSNWFSRASHMEFSQAKRLLTFAYRLPPINHKLRNGQTREMSTI